MLPPAPGGCIASLLLLIHIGSRYYQHVVVPAQEPPAPCPEYAYEYYAYDASPKLLVVTEEKEVAYWHFFVVVVLFCILAAVVWSKRRKARQVKIIHLQ